MKEMKKILCLLLCFVMVVGLVPAEALALTASEVFSEALNGLAEGELNSAAPVAQAEGDTIYVLAGGDYQEGNSDGSVLHENSSKNVTNILTQIGAKYSTMDGFLFIGDYDGTDHNNATNVANGITSLMTTIQAKYSNINDDNSILVQGNHDNMDSRIDATGGHELDGYSVYVLNEDDYVNGGGTESGVKTLAANLEAWLNNKIGEGYDAPIFVTAHVPLHYSPRTKVQGDGAYAKYIFDVLNAAGEDGLNIIFLHGHDHAYGCDNYLGGEAIYRAEGDTLYVADPVNYAADPADTSPYTIETLNFTYMNAGYTGYYNETGYDINETDDSRLTMTVFAITGTEVSVERYSAAGVYNLSSEGRNGYYSDPAVTASSLGLAFNEKVYTSPQTIALAEVEDHGTIGSYVGVTAGATNDVTTSGGDWETITEPTDGTTTYTYTQATSITAGEEYVIVANDDDIALMDDGGDMGEQSVTTSGSTMTSTTELTRWTFSGSNSGTIYNGTRYLRYSTSNWSSSFNLSTSSSNLTFTDNGSNFRIYNNSNYGTDYSFYYDGSSWTRSSSTQYVRLYQLTDTITTGGTNGLYGKLDGELTYNVAAGTSAEDALAAVKAGIAIKYATAADYSDEAEFADDGEGMTWTLDSSYDGNVPGDYAVTISYGDVVLGTAEVVVPASTTYYIAEGNGLYLVDMNTTADNALAAVKAGVTVYSAADTSGSNKTAISDDDVTWDWVDTYDGADSGPYTVDILYGDTSLGTVEVKVNVKYETVINPDWTYIGETEAIGGSYTYTLDTDGIDSDGQYIIVAESQDLALHTSGSSAASAISVNISSDGKTLTTDTRDYEYYWNSTYGFTRDGYNGLYQSSWAIYLGTKSASYLDGVVNHNNGTYTLYDNEGNERGLYYNGSSWTVNDGGTTTDYKVRLYKYTGMTGGTPAGSIYAKIEGNTVYTVTQGTSAVSALAKVKAGITGYLSSSADGSDKTELADSELTWKWKNTYAGMVTGSYWVEISYNGKVLGTVEVRVEPGVVNNYPEYPNEGAVKVSKTATGVDFQSSGIAQVEVSASGVPIKKGADVIVMLDTSSSMTSWCICGTQNCTSSGSSHKRRSAVLEESLVDLIAQFKTPGDDGQLLDLRVAIADFNGFYGDDHSASGTAYDRDAADTMSDDIAYTANSEAQIYTGDRTLGAGAFINVADLTASYTLNYTSGTNYDYAMDAIYQLGTAIKEANGSEERDLYVIFMSDGAAMQWNYYHSQGNSDLWGEWITGTWSANELTTANLNCTTHAYYYDEVDHDGDGNVNEHRMANAIKGDPSEEFEVIRKTGTLGTATNEDNMYMVPGLGAKMFSIAFDPRADGNVEAHYMTTSIATLASPQPGTTQYYYEVANADELSNAFTSIGSEIAYAASNARFVDQMGDAYNLQMAVSSYSVVDGDATTNKTITPTIEIISYDIYTRQDYLNGDITEDKIGERKGTSTLQEVVKFSDDGTKAYSNLIDVDKDGTYGVTVNADGTYTISDTDDNILGTDGIIYAMTFLYNTNATEVAVDGISIPTGTKADGTTTGSTNVLPSETFYWKLGTVQTSELAMRYYVYLEGSMEGTREGGSYPTNEYANLYYDNYLGNPCHKETVSPVMAWKSANVSYAFYLVNEQGQIIVNQTTGQTGSFANKIAVTNPVVYSEVNLNNDEQIQALNVKAISDDVLPKYYELYDEEAVYEVTINSNSTGSWEITQGNVAVASTYVTQYKTADASAYSNALTNNTVGDDYTHTVVWFAIVWKLQAHPDSVVVDYGLPVDISVLANDMFGDYGKLDSIGAYTDGLENTTAGTSRASGFGSTYEGDYGDAKADTTTGKVRYTLNTMSMDSYEKFAYAVSYSGSENAGYYYDTVTVIPATSIYYEDSFVTYSSEVWTDAEGWVSNPNGELWTSVANADAEQDEDRPGEYSLTDANNIYGYDGAYKAMNTFSLGGYHKATVDYDNSAVAEFQFMGTGFDVISMTDTTTGTIQVQVYNSKNVKMKDFVVDTYYGYTCEYYTVTYTYTDGAWVETERVELEAKPDSETFVDAPATAGEGDTYTTNEAKWVVDNESKAAMWQVPVMKVTNLPYDTYTAKIRVLYDPIFDHNTNVAATYDFYLDAIRIYDPADDGAAGGTTDTTIENAYLADGEGWPSYIELRNGLIGASSFDDLANNVLDTNLIMEGLVFIDGDASVGDAQISDYTSFGPNNEVYLAPGQRVAFLLKTPGNIDSVHVGIKSADGRKASYTITNIAPQNDSENDVVAGEYYNYKNYTIETATEMYYDLTDWKNAIIVISNTGNRYGTEGIISLTNIKSTYTSDPNADEAEGEATIPTAATEAAPTPVPVAYMAEETEELFETYIYVTPATAELAVEAVNAMDDEPEATEPEETEPTVPEETVPEETVPETTVPEETTPEEDQPSTGEQWITETVTKVVETVKKIVNTIFGWIFG